MSLKTGKDLEERNSAGRLLQGNEGNGLQSYRMDFEYICIN